MRRRLAAIALALVVAFGNASGVPAAERTRPRPKRQPPAAAPAPAPPQRASVDPSLKLFPRPPALQPRIQLWTRVYSEVPSNGGLVHDSEYLDVVYDVIQWPKEVSNAEAERRIAAAKGEAKQVLRRLAEGPRTNLAPEEKRVLALWPKGISSAALRAAAERVRFQRGQADKFRAGIVRSGAWEDHIARVFRERGLPGELASLPHVESSYNPRAYSHAAAAGLWQFMPSTGKRFLRIDRAVDERFDPYRSSEAAATFLAENHRMLGTWPLALTAYNHGPGGMARAVRELGTREIDVIVERYQSRSFGFASRNFYTEFVAALDVDRNATRYFGHIERDRPIDTEVIVTDAYYPAPALARAFGVDVGLLRETNLALRESVWDGKQLVPRGYALRVPRVANRPPAAQVLASVPRTEVAPKQVGNRYHIVKRGESLSRIARHYGVSSVTLARANGLRTTSGVRVGQRLRVPGRVETQVAEAPRRAPPRVATAKAKASPAAARSHKVRKGETLSAIARRYGVSVRQLASANGISPKARIKTGQVLRVPTREAKATSRRGSGG